MQGVHLLIVDDDEDDYRIVKSLLDDISRGPYTLDWASSYQEGEQRLRENRHALCLMDYRLGAQDGIALLRRAAALGFRGPIIMLTGMAQQGMDMQALGAGAVDYLVKDGLTAEQLARSIRYALVRSEMETERMERLRAEAENRSKSEFLAHLSHELRTPLSAILGFTELLIGQSTDPDQRSQLHIVHRNGQHLLGLLNDVLDLSKIEAGKLDLEIQAVNLADLLRDIHAWVQALARDKNIAFDMQVQPLPHIVHTDPTRLRQILLNLIGNAIKFTDEGRVVLTVCLREHEGRAQMEFAVRDTGIGIREQHLDSIFQPFVQVRQAAARSRTGTGLGLTISRQLVESLGGCMGVTSVEHLGSEFRFTMDPGDIGDAPREDFRLQAALGKDRGAALPVFKGRVLVVDDLPDMRALIRHYAIRCGLEVVCADNGMEAVAAVDRQAALGQPFDLVLMDIQMPVQDGMAAARALRERGHSCPLVALTAAHMKSDREHYLAAGFDDCLSKPVDQQRMLACLGRFLSVVADSNAFANSPTTPTGANRQVLVVDDASDALQATCGILSLLGWQPLAASNGEQALSLIHNQQPLVALVDLNLPDMSGYELCARLQRLNPEMRLMVVSGEPVDRAQLQTPLAGTLLKPMTVAGLSTLLKNL